MTYLKQAFPFTLFFLLAVVGYGIRSVDWFTAIPGNLGDPRLNSVFLEHLYGWVIGRNASLWSPQFFYPFKNVLAFSDNHFGSAIVYVFFRILGFTREGAMSGWIVIGCALNFIASYWILRKLKFACFAAAAAAFIFTAALPILGDPNHAQLIYRFAIPLCFYYFWIAIQEGQPAKLGIAALWFAEQFFCSIYLGVFLSYLLLATLIASILLDPKRFFSHMWHSWQLEPLINRYLGISASVAGLGLTSLLLWKYQLVSAEHALSWPFEQIDNQVPSLSTFFGPTDFFLGYGVIGILGVGALLFGWSFFRSKPYPPLTNSISSPLQKAMWITVSIVMVITFKFDDFSFYYLLLKIPGIDAIRFVYRIIFVLIWPLAILAGFTLQELLSYINPKALKTQYCCMGLLAAIVCAESLLSPKIDEHTSFIKWRNRINLLRPLLPNPISPAGILFVHNRIHEENALTELDGMVLAQEINRPTFNGFSGHEPTGYHQASLCFSYRDRIKAYQRYAKISNADSNALIERLLHINPNLTKDKPFSYSTSVNIPIEINYPNPAKLTPNPLYCGWPSMATWETWSKGMVNGLLLPLPLEGNPQVLELEIGIQNNSPLFTPAIDLWIDNSWQQTFTLDQTKQNRLMIKIPVSSQEKGWIFVEMELSQSSATRISDKPSEISMSAIKIEKLRFLP